MEKPRLKSQKNSTLSRIVRYFSLAIFLLLTILFIYIYSNFNKLLTSLVHEGFDSNVISNVYQLNFQKLRFDILRGNIRVYNVEIKTREKPLKVYPYINSSFSLKTEKILLRGIELMKLIREGKLQLTKIEIVNPEIELKMNGEKIEFLPHMEKAEVDTSKTKKKSGSYLLSEFQLKGGKIRSYNSIKNREFSLDSMNISINGLKILQDTANYDLIVGSSELHVGRFSSILKNDRVRNLNFSGFNIKIDSVDLKKNVDTLIYHYKNYSLVVQNLDIQTYDSVYQIGLKKFGLSYKEKSLKIDGFYFLPDVKKAAKLEKFKFQLPPIVSLKADKINLSGLNLDSLIFKQILVDKIMVDKVDVNIYKDKNKLIDKTRMAEYPGQKIFKLKFPVRVNLVEATNLNIENNERKKDGKWAKVKVQKTNATITNYTNMPTDKNLQLKGSGYIENTAFFNINLSFDYKKPQFSFDAKINKFDLTGLNPLLQSYTPVQVHNCLVDNVELSGNAYETGAKGKLIFLYHDLDIDLQLKERSKWQNSLITFAANSFANNSNPVKAGEQPKVATFTVARDMNKGFLNVVLKSLFAGLKDTFIASKEKSKKDKGKI